MNRRASLIVIAALAAALIACGSFEATGAPVAGGVEGGSPPAPGAAEGGVLDGGPVADAAPKTRAEQYRDAVLADAPIAYWRLDDAASATTVACTDSSLAASFLKGRPEVGAAGLFADGGGAFVFAGTASGQRLASPAPYRGDLAFTVEAWIRSTSAEDGTRRHVFYHSEAGDDHAYSVYLVNNFIVGEYEDGDQNVYIEAPRPTRDVWHHIVLVSPLAIYVDGQGTTASKTSADQPPLFGATLFHVGAPADGQSSFAGGITEVALYDRALTPLQINEHYRLGVPPP